MRMALLLVAAMNPGWAGTPGETKAVKRVVKEVLKQMDPVPGVGTLAECSYDLSVEYVQNQEWVCTEYRTVPGCVDPTGMGACPTFCNAGDFVNRGPELRTVVGKVLNRCLTPGTEAH